MPPNSGSPPDENAGAGISRDMHRRSGPTYWFDVEDILVYFAGQPHPTGIQRVSMELLALAHRQAKDRIGFCRVSFGYGRIEALTFEDIEKAWSRPPSSTLLETCARWARHFLLRPLVDRWRGAQREKIFEQMAQPGDVIVCLGSPMLDKKYNVSVAKAKKRLGLRYALLLHDILPVVQPDMFDNSLLKPFQRWLPDVVAISDLLLVSSQHGRNELVDYGRRHGFTMPPVARLKFGAGFRDLAASEDHSQETLPKSFVLFVATLEIRKNHRLMVRVWRRLIEKHGFDNVPTLLFIGRMGWKIGDLMAELRAGRFLDGKIVLTSGVSDAMLKRAYAQCLFTIYPSFCEGWGLPVAESLAHGKLCIASNRTALPEAGGEFADYIDPNDEDGALAAVERALFENGYLNARETHIREHYQPPQWEDCLEDLMNALDGAFAGKPAASRQ